MPLQTSAMTPKGLFISLYRTGGAYVLRLTRDGAVRTETYASRDDAWMRVATLRGVQ